MRLKLVASVGVLVALYVLFVVHFWSNAPNADDWSAVSLVNTAFAGHLTFGALWAQHLDNRTLIPNLGFVGLGLLTHENLQAQIVVNTVVFVAAFLVFLYLLRAYLGRLTPFAVLTTGVVWFSLVDGGSALWAFQLTWYLIVALLVAMLYLLLLRDLTWPVLVLAGLCAVAASYSSTQGLLLWPIGFMCIVWLGWRRVSWAWIGGAVITGATYFVGYQTVAPNPGNLFPSQFLGVNFSSTSPSYVIHHPVIGIEFLLIQVGNVFPIGPLWLRGIIGAVLLVAAGWVVVRSLRNRIRIECLPVALIAFSVLFDVLTMVGRSRFGLSYAVVSRYTMSNLLLVVAVVTCALRLPAKQLVAIVLVVILATQVVISTSYGISQARTSEANLRMGARLAVTLDLVPPAEQLCYRVTGLFDYVMPNLSASFVSQLRQHRLTIFAPGPYEAYRAEGLPRIAGCGPGE